uniref:Uncharacterized protein n=1 Tax=Plectus sambesii TaxID=2011161 RepID=A0A914V2G7_9BILA
MLEGLLDLMENCCQLMRVANLWGQKDLPYQLMTMVHSSGMFQQNLKAQYFQLINMESQSTQCMALMDHHCQLMRVAEHLGLMESHCQLMRVESLWVLMDLPCQQIAMAI